MVRLSGVVTGALLLALAGRGIAFAQTTTGADVDPDVRLEVRGGKTQFYLGDRIELDLLKNGNSGPYFVDSRRYDDKVEITPAKGWMKWRGAGGSDFIVAERPTDRITVVLNERVVFRDAGHYEVRVMTGRMSQGKGAASNSSEMVTNTVGIDLVAMPPAVEAARVQSLMAEIAKADVKTREGYLARRDAVERLADLQGDNALKAKIDLILGGDHEMWGVTWEAVASTRNLELQLAMLEAAWRDPTRPPVVESPINAMPAALQMTRALIRGDKMDGQRGMIIPPPTEAEKAQAKQNAEDHVKDVQVLIDSLPARSGKNRTDTVFYLIIDRGLTPAQRVYVERLISEEFPHMSVDEQRVVLEAAKPTLNNAVLIPELQKMLEKSPTDRDAIARLIAVDPTGAKPYVVRAICNTGVIVRLEDVQALPDATLPEVDACLEELIRADPNRWYGRAMLAARFGSEAVVPVVKEGWKDPEQNGPVLALMLRYEPQKAVEYLQSHPQQPFMVIPEINQVFKARRASFPVEMRTWLREQIAKGDGKVAASAAMELAQYGVAEDRGVIEERLAKLRAFWAMRAGKMDDADRQSPIGAAVQLELDLVKALTYSEGVFRNRTDIRNLVEGCLSEKCQLYGRPNGDVRPSGGPPLRQ